MCWQLSAELESYNLREDHGNLLTKHDRLSLNSTNSPANNSKTINHSGVRVSAHNGIWIENSIFLKDDTSKPFKVDLMNNSIAWWHNLEIRESGLSPFEESESLFVPVELNLLVAFLGILGSSDIDLDRVIDDEI